MKIAILGCGYVGRAIAHLWYQSGHDLTVTTTTPTKIPELKQIATKAVVLKGNDRELLKEILSDRELVLLCIGAPNRNLYQETYLKTAKNLIATLQENHSVKQVIYTGSFAILGDKGGKWTDEESPVAPANENNRIMAETESVLLSASDRDLKVCILRLAGIYGSGRELIKIFGRYAGQVIDGDGENYSNWVHLDDIVGAIEFVRLKQLAGIYHLVGDEVIKRRELFECLLQQHGLEPVVWDASKPSARPHNLRLSNQKIKAAGYRFIRSQLIF